MGPAVAQRRRAGRQRARQGVRHGHEGREGNRYHGSTVVDDQSIIGDYCNLIFFRVGIFVGNFEGNSVLTDTCGFAVSCIVDILACSLQAVEFGFRFSESQLGLDK